MGDEGGLHKGNLRVTDEWQPVGRGRQGIGPFHRTFYNVICDDDVCLTDFLWAGDFL